MKKSNRILIIAASLFISFSAVQAAKADVNATLTIPGMTPMNEPPVFILPQLLGFYVAVGTPDDMFYVDSVYYVNKGGRWFTGSRYNGPWTWVQNKMLPVKLRSYKYDQLVRIKNQETKIYNQDRNHYRGKQYRPVRSEMQKERNVERKDMQDRRDMRDRKDARDKKDTKNRRDMKDTKDSKNKKETKDDDEGYNHGQNQKNNDKDNANHDHDKNNSKDDNQKHGF